MPVGGKESPRCLIVDDHPVVRAGVRAVLEQSFERPRVADAATIEEASGAFDGEPPDATASPAAFARYIARSASSISASASSPCSGQPTTPIERPIGGASGVST